MWILYIIWTIGAVASVISMAILVAISSLLVRFYDVPIQKDDDKGLIDLPMPNVTKMGK